MKPLMTSSRTSVRTSGHWSRPTTEECQGIGDDSRIAPKSSFSARIAETRGLQWWEWLYFGTRRLTRKTTRKNWRRKKKNAPVTKDKKMNRRGQINVRNSCLDERKFCWWSIILTHEFTVSWQTLSPWVNQLWVFFRSIPFLDQLLDLTDPDSRTLLRWTPHAISISSRIF